MRTSYMISHVLVQASLVTIALFFLPLFGFLVTGNVWSSVGLLAALSVARMIAFVLGQFIGMKGYAWDTISMFLVATITMLGLWFSGLGDFDAMSWFIMFFLLVFTYIFAHGILQAAGAKPKGEDN